MDPLTIQFELRKRHVTQAAIAREASVTEIAVSRVISRKMRSDNLQRLVADKIGKPVEAVFPDRYGQSLKVKS